MKEEFVKTQAGDIELSDENFVQLDPFLTHIGYFSVEERGRVRATSKSLTVNLKGNAIRVELNALDKLDLPRTADLDKYIAFAKLLYQMRQRGELKNPIPLLSQDLLREVKHKKRYNDYEFNSVKEWLRRLRSTEIICESVSGNDTPELGLITGVFHKILYRGDKFEDTVAKTNLIWMDDLLLKKFNEFETLPIDFDGYKQLKRPISRNLVPLLSKWLYAARNRDRFERNYNDLSDLLGTVRCHHQSDIKKQLFPALFELQNYAWIDKYDIEKNNQGGFKICITHGERFKKIIEHHEHKKSMTVVPGNQYHLPYAGGSSGDHLRLVQQTSSANQPTGKSKYSYQQWLEYARSQANLTNPSGFADKAYLTGEKDHVLEYVLNEKEKMSATATGLTKDELKMITRFCPHCYGSGHEIVPGKGARECNHSGLTLEKLKEACEDGDLPEELLLKYETTPKN